MTHYEYVVSCLTKGFMSLQLFSSKEQAIKHIRQIKSNCPNAEILTQKKVTIFEEWEPCDDN
ncbi:hypothetical protein LU293_03960 [Moraxella nasovis]|uniref:hypothetical protein n=1 Tax=Moraxella nasovis TaxID=2904121 RepID=UPI001F61C133|nr:hypothetical protein [Moraxella nasovis]UNU74056.1 hypothetical protein LU293_03960 [Moraxella nasovis]